MKGYTIQIRKASLHQPVDDITSIFRVRCSVTENFMSPEELRRLDITPSTVTDMLLGGDYIVPVASVSLLGPSSASASSDTLLGSLPVRHPLTGGSVAVAYPALALNEPVADKFDAARDVLNDGLVVGFGMAQISQGYVFALFVDPAYENNGIGGALLSWMEQGLVQHGVGQAWLVTDADPAFRAHGFYERMGWERRGLLEDGQRQYSKKLL